MPDARTRIQTAIARSGLSLRRIADVSGVVNSSQLSKFMRGVQFDLLHARTVVETAETLADLYERGEVFRTDSVERMREAVEADRAKIESAVEALALLGS